MPKISGVSVRYFMGLQSLDVDLTGGDATVATGTNKRGKTSFAEAINAGLCGIGTNGKPIGADAIRHGADRSEVFIRIDDLIVRRTIGPNKSSVAIMRGGTDKEHIIASKQAFLTERFGGGALDPLDLYLKKPKERREAILNALPLTVTLDDLRRFAPELPDDFDVSGHGLVVLERAHTRFFDARTEANRAAKDAKTAKDQADKLAAAAAPEEAITVAAAQSAVVDAESAIAALATRGREAAAAIERTTATRGRIETLRAQADTLAAARAAPSTYGEATEAERTKANADAEAALAAAAVVTDLEKRLIEARALALTAADLARASHVTYNARLATIRLWEADQTSAAQMRAQADELAAAIGTAAVLPTEEESAAVARARVEAEDLLARAQRVEAGRTARAKAVEAATALTVANEKATRLDTTVKALEKDAPAALLATTAIRGLTLDGDEVLLDGKRLDSISGSEQLEFAVEIAKRANDKRKFLVVDGLERIAPSEIERFVKLATAQGWQLIATRVADGDLVFDYYTSDDGPDAAPQSAAAE